MKSANRRRRARANPGRRNYRPSPWAIWLYGLPAAAIVLGVLHCFGYGPFQSLLENVEQEDQLETRIEELHQENTGLNEEIESLMPGRFGIEKRAREQLGWSKPGEIVVHLPDKH